MYLSNTTVAEATRLPLPHIAPIPSEGDEWILLEDYRAIIDGVAYFLPFGLRSDLASIPRPVSWIVQPHELSALAPYLHDALYRTRGELPRAWVKPYRTFDRLAADRLFRRVMELERVPRWRRDLGYRGVRIGGAGAWGRERLKIAPYLAFQMNPGVMRA